ncbi:hypothetical protein CHARACLAT_010976 [Characodon lateralis]|uniref:MHC class I-like antigen recognition-like domain-containing protein n=1 Tax=Characodon lateralis TaxID=208331 RepID=A0ABU7E8R5_9TELE|nr:hypothetical protein [Characodon lateralis]
MNFTVEDWDIQTQVCLTNQQIIKANLEIAKQRFNYTEGVHIYQAMYGCQWDDETGQIHGYEHKMFRVAYISEFQPANIEQPSDLRVNFQRRRHLYGALLGILSG